MLALLDRYTRVARATPVLLTLLPLLLLVLGCLPSHRQGLGMLLGVLSYCAVGVLLAQVGRDFGKRREQSLFLGWGGSPTIKRLQHRGAKNIATLTRYHLALARLIPGLVVPTLEDESRNPAVADEVYASAVTFLRNATRDRVRYPLVFAENVNYGFRRNLLGLRPAGMSLAACSAILAGSLLFLRSSAADATQLILLAAAAAISTALLLIWTLVITPEWVKVPAEAYAERLLETLDGLISGPPGGNRAPPGIQEVQR